MKIKTRHLILTGLLVFIFLVLWFTLRPAIFISYCEDRSYKDAKNEFVVLLEESNRRVEDLESFDDRGLALNDDFVRVYTKYLTENNELRNIVNNGGYQEETRIGAYYSCLRSYGID